MSRDVTFDEEVALKKSRRCHLEEVYEEEPVNPRTTESMREVPRAEEPVREVIACPDEETLEDHDIIEVQEPPQMTFSHKRNPAWARELIQDGEKYGVPEGTTKIGEETKAILQLHGFDVKYT
jgi:U3 small nucleolar RNA-associated protein 14